MLRCDLRMVPTFLSLLNFNFDCFEIKDRASSYFGLQIEEAMHSN